MNHNYAKCTRANCNDCKRMQIKHAREAVKRNTSESDNAQGFNIDWYE